MIFALFRNWESILFFTINSRKNHWIYPLNTLDYSIEAITHLFFCKTKKKTTFKWKRISRQTFHREWKSPHIFHLFEWIRRVRKIYSPSFSISEMLNVQRSTLYTLKPATHAHKYQIHRSRKKRTVFSRRFCEMNAIRGEKIEVKKSKKKI